MDHLVSRPDGGYNIAMAIRLIEFLLPTDRTEDGREALEKAAPGVAFQEWLNDGRIMYRLVVGSDNAGPIIDLIEQRFGQESGFFLTVTAVEAVIPRLEKDEPEPEPDADDDIKDADESMRSGVFPPLSMDEDAKPAPLPRGLNREELYNGVNDMVRLSWVFVLTALLSAIVAAVGVMRNNVAVIIGAMVIAPLLGPNVGFAFATTLTDWKLMRRSFGTMLVGMSISLALAFMLGVSFTFDPALHEIHSRTFVGLSDVVLALAAGSAGTLALTRGVPTALVGVMVAVALLPPTVVVGLLVGAGEWSGAAGAAMLVATNVICVNLAGVVTFLGQGVQPLSWWEARRARRASWIAVAIWVSLLAILVLLIVVGGDEHASPPTG
jgi:uncharacterized hydrophobic protein (TIGR00341 family)